MFRRLYECLYIHQFGQNSTMCFIHYASGINSLSICWFNYSISINKYGEEKIPLLNYCLGLILFLNASYIQYQIHLTLTKNPRTENENYPIPNGYWPFEYFSCPNYIAEMFIYHIIFT